MGDNMRTNADSKYRPIRREFSRYGKIEKALESLKADPALRDKDFTARIVSQRSGVGNAISAAMILMFTKGVESTGKGTYKFNEDEIRVENSKGSKMR